MSTFDETSAPDEATQVLVAPTGRDSVEVQSDAMAEAKALLADLRDAAADGRFLARRYAELLTQAVDDYCDQFEKRADAVLSRLEEVKR